MKYAKKMMLVDIPHEQNQNTHTSLSDQSNFIQNYLSSKTAFNIDQELRNILNRVDLSDHEKWKLYNQSFQRFLFLLEEERRKKNHSFMFQNINAFNKAPSSMGYNSISRNEAPYIRTPIQGLEKFDEMKFPDSINIYNPNNKKGHFDMNRVEDSSDSDDMSLEENELKQIRGSSKRESLTTPNIPRKHFRFEKKPIYSYMYAPPLQRWAIDMKGKVNKSKQQRLLTSNSQYQHESDDDVIMTPSTELMDTEESNRGRKRKHDEEDSIPNKIRALNSPSMKPTILLPRLPKSLTKEKIKQLIRKNEQNRVKISKWEKVPKQLRKTK